MHHLTLLSALVIVSPCVAQWEETRRITAPDGIFGDYFGGGLAVNESYIAVGATGDDDHAGAVYVFARGSGELLHKLVADDRDAFDSLGYSVAIEGNTILASAHLDDDIGLNAGAAYLFDAVSGEIIFKLTATDGAEGDLFGRSVDLDGGVAIIGTDGVGAYIFDTTTGAELRKLVLTDPPSPTLFGSTVAISGTRAIVDDPYDDADIAIGAGAVYVYDVASGAELHRLTASDAAGWDLLGVSLDIDGTTIIAGAANNADQVSQAAYVFDAVTGAELHKLTADDGHAGAWFGFSVAVLDGIACVGAHEQDGEVDESGAAYVFDLTSGAQTQKLTASDANSFDDFGTVAIHQDVMVVGAILAGTPRTGAAYVFTPVCVADVNGDGVVEFGDLLTILSNWGPCAACPEDIDGNGEVDFQDLLGLLFGWGPC